MPPIGEAVEVGIALAERVLGSSEKWAAEARELLQGKTLAPDGAKYFETGVHNLYTDGTWQTTTLVVRDDARVWIREPEGRELSLSDGTKSILNPDRSVITTFSSGKDTRYKTPLPYRSADIASLPELSATERLVNPFSTPDKSTFLLQDGATITRRPWDALRIGTPGGLENYTDRGVKFQTVRDLVTGSETTHFSDGSAYTAKQNGESQFLSDRGDIYKFDPTSRRSEFISGLDSHTTWHRLGLQMVRSPDNRVAFYMNEAPYLNLHMNEHGFAALDKTIPDQAIHYSTDPGGSGERLYSMMGADIRRVSSSPRLNLLTQTESGETLMTLPNGARVTEGRDFSVSVADKAGKPLFTATPERTFLHDPLATIYDPRKAAIEPHTATILQFKPRT